MSIWENPDDDLYIGIDPGLSGSIGYVYPKFSCVVPMPVVTIGRKKDYDLPEICKLLAAHWAVAVIERSQPMPGQGVSSTFRTGYGYGILKGILAARCVKTIDVPPRTWKKAFGLTSDKGASIKLAKERFPSLVDDIGRNHNKAEAILLAEYGRMNNL